MRDLILERFDKNEIMARRMLCSTGVFYLSPSPMLLIDNSPEESGASLEDIDSATLDEMTEYLSSYRERALVIDHKDRVLAVLPSFYPASSLGVILSFDMKTGSFWRMVSLCGAEDIFVCSAKTQKTPSRLSKEMREQKDAFSELFADIRSCFVDLERFSRFLTEDEKKREMVEQCRRLSCFVGCPAYIDEVLSEDVEASFELADFPLFSAFVITMLLSARRNAIDRCARIILSPQFSSVTVSVSFVSYSNLKSEGHMASWKYLSYDKNMLFDIAQNNGEFTVRFNPCRTEWSKLGLKQGDGFDSLGG